METFATAPLTLSAAALSDSISIFCARRLEPDEPVRRSASMLICGEKPQITVA